MSFRIVALIIFIAVLASGIFFFAFRAPATAESSAAIEQAHARILNRPGNWAPVKRGNFEISVTEEGELRPVKVTSLTFLSPGKIGFIVPEGTVVAKGDRVIALETRDLEEEISHMQEDLAAAEVNLAQQEQTRDLELKRLAADMATEKENTEFASLKLRETLAHPNDVEKEEARNLLDGAEARLKASQTDLELFKPLLKQGFGSKEEYDLKEVAYAKASIEKERADMKARVIRDGALPDDRLRAELDNEYAKLGLDVKTIDTEDQADALSAKVKVAERAVKALKRKLEKRQLELERSTLRAPHDGVVVYRQMSYRGNKKPEVGERASPWIAPVDLPNYERMKVRTQVPESLIRKIQARPALPEDGKPAPEAKVERGSPARVIIKTIPGVVYTAQVTWIDGWARDRNSKLADADIKAQGLSGVKVFDVEVELDESDPKHLREGFRASVDFPEETIPNVIAIPEQSVSTVDGVSSVMVMNGSTPEARKITLGRASQGRVHVKTGLKENELIYVPRLDKPTPVEAKKANAKKDPGDNNKKGNNSKKSSPPAAGATIESGKSSSSDKQASSATEMKKEAL